MSRPFERPGDGAIVVDQATQRCQRRVTRAGGPSSAGDTQGSGRKRDDGDDGGDEYGRLPPRER